MQMEQKLNREELMQILGVKNESLKWIIKSNKLKERLVEKGYRYINKIKDGRKSYYIVEVFNVTNNIESLNNICTGVFNTRKQKEFSNYYLYRTLNTTEPLTKQFLSDLSNVNVNTISKWDKSMIENNIMTKDGYFYVAMSFNPNDEEGKPYYKLTDKYEYNSFIKNNLSLSKRKKAYEDLQNGTIDKITYDIIMDGTTACMLANKNKIVYKVTKYQLEKANIDFIKLIEDLIMKVYMIDKNNYLINLNN